MTRTIDSIVANHHVARARIAEGKPIWDSKINLKAILHEDQTNLTAEHIVSVANRIAKLIRSKAPKTLFDITNEDVSFDFLDAIEGMEQCTLSSLASDLELGDEPHEVLNEWLRAIYDWADTNRIWIGP